MNSQSAHRLSELDGLRGLAILMVMFFHIFTEATPLLKRTSFEWLTDTAGAGWIGVDIFFVLSGFLITTILLNTRKDPHYFKNFYARRVLRIFPLYVLIVGGVLLFLPLINPETGLAEQASWPYFVLYLQNWLVIPSLHLGAFSLLIGPSWSLAIEEQFYLVWPALVFFSSRRKLAFLSVAIVVLSLVGRLLFVHFSGYARYDVRFLYFGSLTRFDGFAIGALIALAFQSPRWKQVFFRFAWPVFIVAVLGLAAIVLKSGNVSPLKRDYLLNTWGYSLIALAAGALLVIATTSSKSALLPRFFRMKVLSFLGKYSYAMYLVHYPVALILFDAIAEGYRRNIRVWLIYVGLTFFVTIVISVLTWVLLENPMLKLKKYFEYETVDVVEKVQTIESSKSLNA